MITLFSRGFLSIKMKWKRTFKSNDSIMLMSMLVVLLWDGGLAVILSLEDQKTIKPGQFPSKIKKSINKFHLIPVQETTLL